MNDSGSTPDSNCKKLHVIWDDDKIEKYIDNDGTQKWKCLWCGKSFLYWNATKALFHVNKEGGGNVRRCMSHTIDKEHRQEYKRLLDKYMQQKQSQKSLTESKKRSSSEYIVGAANAYSATRRKKVNPAIASDAQPTAESVPPRKTTALTFPRIPRLIRKARPVRDTFSQSYPMSSTHIRRHNLPWQSLISFIHVGYLFLWPVITSFIVYFPLLRSRQRNISHRDVTKLPENSWT